MMYKEINFDMDGTIANLYAVNGWLEDLNNYCARPYEVAEPMLNLSALARVLNRKQREGYTLRIISWLSKYSNEEYDRAVTEAKIEWLARHLPSVHWDEIKIVSYGTPKQTLGNGILFDDEIGNRNAWGEGAYDVQNIIEILKAI